MSNTSTSRRAQEKKRLLDQPKHHDRHRHDSERPDFGRDQHLGHLGAGAYANATTDVTSSQNVTLGSGATLIALGDVNLTPGLGASYDPNTALTTTTPTALSGNSDAQSYVTAGIAVTDASATTSLVSKAALVIATGDTIISGEDTNSKTYE